MTVQKPLLDPLISAPDSNEYFNSISHLIGAILSISALTVLVSLAAIADKPIHVVGFAIYGVSLFLSFLFSCLLHFFLLFGKYLRIFGILDHNAIYILIAGTYTPFCLTIFSGATAQDVYCWGTAPGKSTYDAGKSAAILSFSKTF